MLLKDLINDDYIKEIDVSLLDKSIEEICIDSRCAGPKSLFVALKGVNQDGHDYIKDAIQRGVKVIVAERPVNGLGHFEGCLLLVEDSKRFLQEIVKKFYNDPSQKIKIIGVTGTNGKTTVTYLLESMITTAGDKCGVIGTVNYRFNNKIIQAKNTTPGMPDLYKYLDQMVGHGMGFCAMEVSSHALEQGRHQGLNFLAAIFTNLTSEHLDYHQTQEQYFYAKAKLFQGLASDKLAFVNVDDPWGRRLIEMVSSKMVTYGIHNRADVQASNITTDLSGVKFTMKKGSQEIFIDSPLIGIHNVYNILAASAACLCIGFPEEKIQKGIKAVKNVPGRMESIYTDKDFYVFVDYAHTEDALRHALKTLRDVATGKLIVVFGCGGDRDTTKRPKMGQVASQLADVAIVTNDNPRTEVPQQIIDEIIAGFEKKNYQVIMDRKHAIQEALQIAQGQDVVLIAGKGHENYQIFKEETVPFDERAIVKDLLRQV